MDGQRSGEERSASAASSRAQRSPEINPAPLTIKSEPTARKLRAAVFLEAKSALVCETVNFHAREANMLRCYARASCLILKNIQNINK